MKDNLSYNERKHWAKTLYTKQGVPGKDVALEVGVDEATVRAWAQEDNWEDVKQVMLISKEVQLRHLYSQLARLNEKMNDDKEINAKNMDLVAKYTASIKNLEADPPLADIIETFGLFVQWLRRKNRPFTQKLVAYFDAFISECITC